MNEYINMHNDDNDDDDDDEGSVDVVFYYRNLNLFSSRAT